MVSNKNLLTIVLVVLLILAVGYIGFEKYNAWRMTGDVVLYQTGAQDAILTIAQQAGPGSCQPVPLVIGNQTINVIAVECLQVAPAQTAVEETAEETAE